MAKELIELGSRKGPREPRVCFKVRRNGQQFSVATYDRKSGQLRNWIAAPCLRVSSKKKAMKFVDETTASAYAKKCRFRCKKK